MPGVEIRRVQFPVVDEQKLAYGGRPLAEIPLFKRTRFSSRLFFTDERVFINIIVAALSSFDLAVSSINKSDVGDFEVKLSDGSSITIEAKSITTRELYITQQIQDLSAGLNEWVLETPDVEERMRRFQVSFVIPEFEQEGELDSAWNELRRYIADESFPGETSRGFASIPDTYPTLAALQSQVLVREGSPPFIQVTQGARAVGSAAVGNYELLQRLHRLRLNAEARRRNAQWLIVWFQSIYEPFSVEAARDFLEETDISPYERIIVADGRQLAATPPL